MILGKGSYGEVIVRNNEAVKKFSKLSHLIQEYAALSYLSDCKNIVHTNGADFENLELRMELFDCSLRNWLDRYDKPEQSMIIIKDILLGLIELHDRRLAHGDLKPNNILIKKSPLKAVLGDCGFVSIDKYAKVERTAEVYRDPIISHSSTHDIYSFGICFIEIVGEIKIYRQPTYKELKIIINNKIKNKKFRNLAYDLVSKYKERRPKAREIINELFNESPNRWNNPLDDSYYKLSKLDKNEIETIREIMKSESNDFNILRGKKGFNALTIYFGKRRIKEDYVLHSGVVLIILSSLFGKPGYRERNLLSLPNIKRNDLKKIPEILNKLLENKSFVNLIFRP